MNVSEADRIAGEISKFLISGDSHQACLVLEPILDQRAPFRVLDRIAAGIGRGPQTNAFLERIAEGDSEGGWVIIGGILRQQYPDQPATTVDQCCYYIVAADTWYGADILGERVAGPALQTDFARAQSLLSPWRSHENRWVRRSVGVAAHFWAKRSRGDQVLKRQAAALLAFLAPMYEEWEMDAVKGVGWGLKTLGRNYPDVLTTWLLAQRDRPHRRLLLRKAVTYLSDEDRRKVLEAHGW